MCVRGVRPQTYASACISFHLHPPPTPTPPGQELFTSLSAMLPPKQGPHPYSPTSNSSAYLKPLPNPWKGERKKTRRGKKNGNLPVLPSAHTYIHKHVFMKARGKRARAAVGGGGMGGEGIRITLNSKQGIVGPWRLCRTELLACLRRRCRG